jgi:hypothetical protein
MNERSMRTKFVAVMHRFSPRMRCFMPRSGGCGMTCGDQVCVVTAQRMTRSTATAGCRPPCIHVAHSFADELARTNPQFDRFGFVSAAADGRTR